MRKTDQKKQPKKVFLELEKKIHFECFQKEVGCFHNNGDGARKPCPKSPCPLNLFKFGTHERILENFLDNEEWDEAYFYFQDLLPQFSIDCDVKQLEDIRKSKTVVNTEDLPPGCRVFKISDELRKIKNDLKIYKDQSKEEISIKGKKTYNLEKVKFRKKLFANLEILKHLAIDKRQQHDDDLLDKKYKLLAIQTQMGDLKPEALELPIHKDVEDAIKDKKNKKDKIAGF